MKISVAQIRPAKGDITANMAIHKKMIGLAATHKAKAIFFPELSLTGLRTNPGKRTGKKPGEPDIR